MLATLIKLVSILWGDPVGEGGGGGRAVRADRAGGERDMIRETGRASEEYARRHAGETPRDGMACSRMTRNFSTDSKE